MAERAGPAWCALAAVCRHLPGDAGHRRPFAPQIAPPTPNRQHLIQRLQPPLSPNEQGESMYWLGSDGLGRGVPRA